MVVVKTEHSNMVNITWTVSTLTYAFDCLGWDTILVCSENAVNTANDTTGVTYNGVAMTEIWRLWRPAQSREITMWGLHSPASGSNNVVITRTTSSSLRLTGASIAFSWTDTWKAIPTAEDDYAKTLSNTSTSISITLANEADCAVYAVWVFGSWSQSASTWATLLSSVDIVSDFEASTFPATANYTIWASATSWGNAFIAVAITGVSIPAWPANLKTYNTNVLANIKTINTNTIANVKSLNTNT